MRAPLCIRIGIGGSYNCTFPIALPCGFQLPLNFSERTCCFRKERLGHHGIINLDLSGHKFLSARPIFWWSDAYLYFPIDWCVPAAIGYPPPAPLPLADCAHSRLLPSSLLFPLSLSLHSGAVWHSYLKFIQRHEHTGCCYKCTNDLGSLSPIKTD